MLLWIPHEQLARLHEQFDGDGVEKLLNVVILEPASLKRSDDVIRPIETLHRHRLLPCLTIGQAVDEFLQLAIEYGIVSGGIEILGGFQQVKLESNVSEGQPVSEESHESIYAARRVFFRETVRF